MRIAHALTLTFTRPLYATVAIVVSIAVFALSVWIQNLHLLIIILSSAASTRLKFDIFLSMLGSIATNYSLFSASYTVAIAVLFGINIALVVKFFAIRKSHIRSSGTTASSFLGLVSGMLGIGCAACGTFVLVPLLSLFGAAGLVAFLPFGGEEFGVLGVLVLLFSIYSISIKLTNPQVCKVTKPNHKSKNLNHHNHS